MKKLSTIIICMWAILPVSHVKSQQSESKGKISGVVYADYFYNLSRDANLNTLSNVTNKGEEEVSGVQIRRIYFTYDYTMSTKFSTRFRLEADQAALTSDEKIGVFVKDAYLKWHNIFKGSDLLFGIQPTPSFEISESYWGHRYLEKTIMDLRGIVSSRDLAVSLSGKLNAGGNLKYTLMLGNSSGNKPEKDKYKRYYAVLQYSPVQNMAITFHSDLRTAAPAVDPLSTIEYNANIFNYGLFAGYKIKDKFSVGVEGYTLLEKNKLAAAPNSENVFEDRSGLGVSIFGSVFFSEKISSALRYDYFDPNIDNEYSHDKRGLIIASLNYKVEDKVVISPNVLVESYEKLANGNSIKSSVTPRITFFYSF